MAARVKSGQERIREFLERALPKKKKDDRDEVEVALLRAADRYDLYASHEKDWFPYRERKENLLRISEGSLSVADCLAKLDIMSREDLEARLGRERVMAIIGDLRTLAPEVAALYSGIKQKIGKPRDLAKERWIQEVALIYENAFEKRAKVWGTGAGPSKKHGPFYELLEMSRPDSFLRKGKLHPKQVRTILKMRSD